MMDAWERETPGRIETIARALGDIRPVAAERSEAVRFPRARRDAAADAMRSWPDAHASAARCRPARSQRSRRRAMPATLHPPDATSCPDSCFPVAPFPIHPSWTSMFFRNLTLFRFPTSLELADLDTGLDECQLKPVGPLELSSRGFVSPFGRDGEALSHRIGDAIWLTVGGEDRLLPGAVVNDMLAKKLAEIEQKEGRKPGGRTRKRLKDDLVHELLPRAFVQARAAPTRCSTCEHGLCVVDTSSPQERRERGQRDPPRAGQFPGAAAECRSRAARDADRLDRRRAAARRPDAGRRVRAQGRRRPGRGGEVPAPGTAPATRSASTWNPASRSRGWR